MKNIIAILGLTLLFAFSVNATAPFDGVLIALDAGHGNGATGAVHAKYDLAEADVNQDVVLALQQKLSDAGAIVVLTDRVSSRRQRVNSALDKCKQSSLNRKCDILVSVHHNGNGDPTHDGTLAIYNEKKDIPLAVALHDALVRPLPLGLGLSDEGYLSGGYGITVYGNLISAVSEAYYITNDCEAELYLFGATQTSSCDKTLYPDGEKGDRVEQEAQTLFDGIENYFVANPVGEDDGGNGNKGNNGKGKNK